MNFKQIISTAFVFIVMLDVAYGEREYRKAYIAVSVPAIVETDKKTLRFENGKVIESLENKNQYVSVTMSLDDMQLNGNSFSGIKVTTFPVYEEITSVRGVLSDDHQTIEVMTIEQQYLKYNIPNRAVAHIEEKRSASFTFKNVPIFVRDYYRYDRQKTEISDARWHYYRYLKYRAISETTVSKMISVYEEGITESTTCVSVRFRPTNYTSERPERNKIAVVTAGWDAQENVKEDRWAPVLGVHAKLVHEFSNVPGLMVLEREKMDSIVQEQQLSESGLVEEESKVDSDSMIDEDILVIIQLQKLAPEDSPETYHCKLLVKNKQTGKLDDPGITMKLGENISSLDHFVMKAYAYVMKNYF